MNIWIPRTRILEPKDAIQLPSVGIAGMVRAIRIGPDGKERWRGPWSKNLWTDPGLNYWLASDSIFTPYGEVGTGNAEPTSADNALQLRVAFGGSGTIQTYNLVDPGGGQLFYGYETRRYTFNPVGMTHNLAEFGVRLGASGTGTLGVRALFRDAGGAPTVITWVTGETLLVDHQVRYYGSPADVTGQITMGTSNVVHDLLMRPASVLGAGGFNNISTGSSIYPIISTSYENATAYTNVTNFGPYTAGVTGLLPTNPTGVKTAVAYTQNSFFRDMQSVWPPTYANAVNGLQAFRQTARPGDHKIQFTPAIMKTSSDTLTLVFSSPTFSRYP